MTGLRLHLRWTLPFLLLLIGILPLHGQQPPAATDWSASDGLPGQMEFGGGFPGLGGNDHFIANAEFQLAEGTRQGRLSLTLDLDDTWHIYSTTQKDGGPQRSELAVAPSEKYDVRGPFKSASAPKIKKYEYFDVPVEEHSKKVTWTAPIELDADVDVEKLEIPIVLNGQVCQDEGSCIPISDRTFVAYYAGTFTPAPGKVDASYRASGSHGTIGGSLQPAVVRPGQVVQVSITAAPDPGWHLYTYAEKDPEQISKPTLIVVSAPPEWQTAAPQASLTPTEETLETGETAFYHEVPVTWTIQVQVPEDAQSGEYEISGNIGYQTCTKSTCDRPLGAQFRAKVTVGDEAVEDRSAFTFTSTTYTKVAQSALEQQEQAATAEASEEPGSEVAGAATGRPPIDFWAELFRMLQFREGEQGWSHAWFPNVLMGQGTLRVVATFLALILGFFAGMILNVMPCVLPVIGLKLMSFISQAGEDRWRIFTLNVWYSLGMWAVFMVFATMAAVLQLLGETFAWGEHLGDPRFSIPLLCLVYILGLSMFGVWEIPIPGFMSTGAASDLAEKEGPAGAFSKGILTTVLATPCSGPLIGVAVGIAVIAPLWLNFAVFTSMALGMAFPYLVVGAFPKLIKALPKPGNWMVAVKQFMGFILMGTGVWILYFLEDRFVIPVLAMLVGVGASCWVVGGTPLTATSQQRLRSWVWAAVFAGVGVLMFSWLTPEAMDSTVVRSRPSEDSPELPWEPYTPDSLRGYQEQGHTVLVDFTADW